MSEDPEEFDESSLFAKVEIVKEPRKAKESILSKQWHNVSIDQNLSCSLRRR